MATPTITGDAPIASGANTSGFVGSPITTSSFAITSGKTYVFLAMAACWTSGDAFGSPPTGSTLSWSIIGSQSHSNAVSSWTIAAWVATAGSSNSSETVSVTETSTGAWHTIFWDVFEITNYNGIGSTHNNNDLTGSNPVATLTPTTIGSIVFSAAICDANAPSAPSGCTLESSQGSGAVTFYALSARTAALVSTTALTLVFTVGGQNQWTTLTFELLPTGGSGTTFTQGLTGTLSSSGVILKRASKLPTGTLTSSGSIVKQPAKLISGTLTSAGSIIKQVSKLLIGTLTASGTLIKFVSKVLLGVLTSSGIIIKQVSRSLVGTLTSSGSLISVKTFLKAIGGTLGSSGTLTKQTQKAISGTLVTSGALIRLVSKVLTGILNSSGLLTTSKVILKALGGTLTMSGVLSKQTQKGFSGILTMTGSIRKMISKQLSGILSMFGLLTKSGGGTVTASRYNITGIANNDLSITGIGSSDYTVPGSRTSDYTLTGKE